MGVVCRAEQQHPVKRQVALKIIKPGMDSEQAVQRFEAERQALALMDHPCIARALDAGTTDTGRLYFVMELVEGVAITQYVDSAQLDIPARLDLFISVCQAIQHAHQRGVIHRDIKPSNILVAVYDGKPVPKVIDFGIAKAIDSSALRLTDSTQVTQLGAVIGTFEYMSPEQAGFGAAVIDTRSDIYSLGVLLYELLAGSTPLDRASLRNSPEHDVLRRIREEDAPPPSDRVTDRRLARILAGDLDWIAMKALEKDPDRRYATVNGLIADVRRHLQGEPVEACPPSTAYRLGKFARRHRAPIAVAVAFLLLAAIGTVISVTAAIRAIRAEAQATAVSSFLQDDVLAQASVRRQSRSGAASDPDLKVRTALDRAAAQIGARFGSQPALEASIRTTIGNSYLELGLDGQAQEHLERAIAIYHGLGGAPRAESLAAMESLERVYLRQTKYQEAAVVAADVWNARRRFNGEDAPETVLAKSRLAIDTAYLNQPAEAEKLIAEAVAAIRRKNGPENPVAIQVLQNQGHTFFAEGNWSQAEKVYLEVLLLRRRLAPEDPDTLDSLTDLSTTYHRLFRFADAEKLEREILDVRRRVLGPDHPDTLQSIANLSVNLNRQQKFAEAEKLDLEILAARARILGADHPVTLQNTLNLALNYLRQGRFEDAERLDAKVVEARKRILGTSHEDTMVAMSNLAADYRWQGKLRESEYLTRELLDLRTRVLGLDHPATRGSVAEMAKVYRAEGNFIRSAEFFTLALNLSSKHHGAEDVGPQRHRSDLAFDLARQGRFREAEPLAHKAFDIQQRVLGRESPYTIATAAVLADVWHGLGRDAEAEKLVREMIPVVAKSAPDSWHVYCFQSLLGAALAGQHKAAEAAPVLLSGYRGMFQRAKTMDAPERVILAVVAGWLADFYAAGGNSIKAAEWRRKASN